MNAWQAVIFDLDDTLYSERDYVMSGFKAVALWAEENLDIPRERGFAKLKRLFERGVRGDTLGCWLASHGLPTDDLEPLLVQIYRGHDPQLTAFPDAPRLLASLRQRYRVGLVSDGYFAVQQRKLKALGLAHYFDTIVFSDELGRQHWKPSTKPFEAALERLAVHPGAAIYVADNPAKDFYGARRAGLFTIRVLQRGGQYAHLDPKSPLYAPHKTFASLAEVERMLVEKLGALGAQGA